MCEVKELDEKADRVGLSQEECARRYVVEDEMIFILTCEDMYWQQRGKQRWVTKGDASTEYFHAVANGRRRRCFIHILREGNDVFSEEGELRNHICGFYHNLLGSESGGAAGISEHMWEPHERVSSIDNETLVCPFSLEEITKNLQNMRVNTAPGPDGFPVIFYKKFWPLLSAQFTNLVNSFTRGEIDVKRLNYGVLALLPKVLGAENIRQFRPITLINVSFHLLAKGFAS